MKHVKHRLQDVNMMSCFHRHGQDIGDNLVARCGNDAGLNGMHALQVFQSMLDRHKTLLTDIISRKIRGEVRFLQRHDPLQINYGLHAGIRDHAGKIERMWFKEKMMVHPF